MNPRVSVLMSVYNGEQYLEEAIESILSQTFNDFEFIIVDDGSSDSTHQILARYQQLDPRIRLLRFDHNQGLSIALNFGIRHVRGEYIARMDADDICLPDRLKEQLAFMNTHAEVGICGTWVELIGKYKGQVWQYPVSHDVIFARMLFANTFVHSSVMIRVAIIRKNNLQYDAGIRYAQDYELWSRAIVFTKFANIDRVLMYYRVHEESIGAVHSEKQNQTKEKVYHYLLSLFDVGYTIDQFRIHEQIGMHQFEGDGVFLQKARYWLEKLLFANEQMKVLSPDVFFTELGEHWTQICLQSNASSLFLFRHIFASPLPFYKTVGLRKFLHVLRFLLRHDLFACI